MTLSDLPHQLISKATSIAKTLRLDALAAPAAKTPLARSKRTMVAKADLVVMPTDNLGYGELGVYKGGVLRGAAAPNVSTSLLTRVPPGRLGFGGQFP
jgi:hypothetical protein